MREFDDLESQTRKRPDTRMGYSRDLPGIPPGAALPPSLNMPMMRRRAPNSVLPEGMSFERPQATLPEGFTFERPPRGQRTASLETGGKPVSPVSYVSPGQVTGLGPREGGPGPHWVAQENFQARPESQDPERKQNYEEAIGEFGDYYNKQLERGRPIGRTLTRGR